MSWRIVYSLIAFSLCGLHSVLGNDALTKQFLEEAPAKWHDYALLLRGFEVESKHTIEFVPLDVKGNGKTLIEHEADRIILDASGMKSIKEMRGYTYGANKDYYFTIGKASSTDQSLSVLNVMPKPTNGTAEALRSAFLRVQTIWSLYPLNLLDAISSPDFKVIKATQSSEGEKGVVQIDFEYRVQHPEPGKVKFRAYNGYVVLAPYMYWGIVRGEMAVDDPKGQIGSYALNNRLEEKLDDIPVVVESEHLTYDTDNNLKGKMTSNYNWTKFRGDDEIFTLSAHGFSEPVFENTNESRDWFLLANIALVLLLALLFVFRHWKRAA